MFGISMRMMRVSFPNGNAEIRDCLAQDWWNFLERALPGEVLVPIPNAPASIGGLLRSLSFAGFILSGGDDWGIFPARDATEKAIFEFAAERKLPLIGVCRGAQALNLLSGGALRSGFAEEHVSRRHTVRLGKNQKFLDGFGEVLEVNSFHANGMEQQDLAACFTPRAWAEDGSVEAFDDGRQCGIMWHPEREKEAAPHDLKLFSKYLKRKQ